MPELRTLPQLCRSWNRSIDTARALIRRRADLRRLGARIGSARVYTVDEAELIRAALAGSRKRPAAAAK